MDVTIRKIYLSILQSLLKSITSSDPAIVSINPSCILIDVILESSDLFYYHQISSI